MRRWGRYILLLCVATAILVWVKPVGAQDSTNKLDDLSNQIAEYQRQITLLQSQANTLTNQIKQFDAQIRLTQLKIDETEERIKLLGGRIDQLEGSLESLTKAFSTRVVETYKLSRVGEPFVFLASSKDLNEAVVKQSYLKKIQESDRDLLVRLQVAQNTYKTQKTESEALQEKLTAQKTELDNQKKAKANLLAATKNDEKRYQTLLAQALAEKAAIERAIASGVKVGPVKRGDVIGLVGNSGWHSDPSLSCSTGKHLHFEVRRDGAWVDPAGYLTSKLVINSQDGSGNKTVGSGDWSWPISDPVRMTQFYGHTPYSYRYGYSGGIHTGYDMVSDSGDIIRAPSDGVLYKSAQRCIVNGRQGNIINIVYIEHSSGLISLYLHLQ